MLHLPSRGRCWSLNCSDDGLFIESAEVGEGIKPPAMKPWTWMGLITIVLLTAVSLYAVEEYQHLEMRTLR